MSSKHIGIVAFQGSVEEHLEAFRALDVPTKIVKTTQDLKEITHLVIPGGESSVIGRFLFSSGLNTAIIEKYNTQNLKIWGTCAGVILLSNSDSPYSLKLIDVEVKRNAYGTQADSFDIFLKNKIASQDLQAIFIRAPKIKSTGHDIEILATHNEDVVLCRNKNILISTFHPELTSDTKVQQYFIDKF